MYLASLCGLFFPSDIGAFPSPPPLLHFVNAFQDGGIQLVSSYAYNIDTAKHVVKYVGEGMVSISGFLQPLKEMKREGGATHRAVTYQGTVLDVPSALYRKAVY